MKPGYCESSHTVSNLTYKLVDKLVDFINESQHFGPYGDVGGRNIKMDLISLSIRKLVHRIDAQDFNFDILSKDIKYGTIFCFEVVEHLPNALFHVTQLKEILEDNGSIFFSIPSKPMFLWEDNHYFEISHKHFEKWIVEYAGLKIVRHKSFCFVGSWTTYLIGFRPFLKVFKTGLKPLLRTLYNKTNFYEVKKA